MKGFPHLTCCPDYRAYARVEAFDLEPSIRCFSFALSVGFHLFLYGWFRLDYTLLV